MSRETGARADTPEHLVVGHIAKAHGTRGELFVAPLTDRPDDVFAAGNQLLLGDEDGGIDEESPILEITEARAFKRGFLLRFEGVDSREDAEQLARLYLLAPTASLPPLDQDEFFFHELIGMSVQTTDGTVVGRVREIYETEPNHLLEIEDDAGKRHLIPFAARIVTDVDRAASRVVIDPPAGLLEL